VSVLQILLLLCESFLDILRFNPYTAVRESTVSYSYIVRKGAYGGSLSLGKVEELVSWANKSPILPRTLTFSHLEDWTARTAAWKRSGSKKVTSRDLETHPSTNRQSCAWKRQHSR